MANMNARLVQSAKWIPVGVFVWVGVGSFMFPDWWHEFLFRGGWHNPTQWFDGIEYLSEWARRALFYEIFLHPLNVLILAVIVVGVRIALKRGVLELPTLGPATWKHQAAAAIVFAAGLIPAWTSGQTHTLGQAIVPGFADPDRSTSDRFSLNEVRDFAYVDVQRVESLFEQILPTMQLSELQTERSTAGSVEGQVGVDKVASAKAGVTSGQKATERYQSTPLTSPRQVGLLLKHFNDRKELRDYESLEVDSEQLRALSTLADLLKQYQISHDSRRLTAVTLETLQKTVDEQQSQFGSLRTPVVIRGAFQAVAKSDTVELSHLFFVRENMIAIRFVIEPFQRNSAHVLSNSLRQLSATGAVFQLAVFGRVVSVLRDNDELKVIVSPYAAWHL